MYIKASYFRWLLLFFVISIFFVSSCFKSEKPSEFAIRFWNVFSQAETSKMEGFFATQIFLPRGSELLAKKWKLNLEGSKRVGIYVDREDLINTYDKMIEQLGQKKWKAIFSTDLIGKIRLRPVNTNNHNYYKGARSEDVIMMVHTGGIDDRVTFVLSLRNKRWQITMTSLILAYPDY